MISGLDFSFGGGLTTTEIHSGGKSFVCRYLSGGNSKDINGTELGAYERAGIPVVFVWETDGIMSSQAEGAGHAAEAQRQLAGIGAATAVVFFAADAQTMPDLTGYLRGAAGVIGKARTGIYGGLGNVKAAFDQGLVAFGWQTYAWSGGAWDNRALLRQVQNAVQFGPAQVDLDEAAYWSSSKVLGLHDDFGQWPRPSGSPPPPPPPKGPFEHFVPAGNTDSLFRVAVNRGLKDESSLVALTRANITFPPRLAAFNGYVAYSEASVAAGMPHPPMGADLAYFTENE